MQLAFANIYQIYQMIKYEILIKHKILRNEPTSEPSDNYEIIFLEKSQNRSHRLYAVPLYKMTLSHTNSV